MDKPNYPTTLGVGDREVQAAPSWDATANSSSSESSRPFLRPPVEDMKAPRATAGASRPASTPEEAATDWGPIEYFDRFSLPPFPVHALPEVLREIVTQLATETQTPPDMAALLSLAVCAASIARKVVIYPRRGWSEPSNIYVAVLMEPANRKSAVISQVTAPLRELESRLIAESKGLIARAASERRQLELKLKKLEKTAGEASSDKTRDKARQDALQLADELANTPVPVPPRLIVDNVTEEKLEQMLAEQGGRIASFSAEGGIFDIMKGKYSSGSPSMDVFLKAHAGDPIVTDRVGRESVEVQRPSLSCGYAVQPQVLKSIVGDESFRGRGLLGRFLYARPESLIGRREVAMPAVEASVVDAYKQCVERLASLDGDLDLWFTVQAEHLLRGWEEQIEGMLDVGGELEYMQDWGGKLAGATVRLAAIIECVESTLDDSTRVGVRSLERAIEIAQYAIPHADAVLDRPDSASHSDARYVERWLRRHGTAEFSKRDVQQDLKRRFPKADDINPALEELCDRNYLRPAPVPTGKVGRPSERYEVNPALGARSTRPRNSQNSGPRPFEVFENATSSDAADDWGGL